MKLVLHYLAVAVLCAAMVYGAWALTRSINYKLSYKHMVQETVREMVKPEALK